MLNDRQIKSFIKKSQKRYEKKKRQEEKIQHQIINTTVDDVSSDVFDEMKKLPYTT
jgi:hypothetical protein